MRTLCVGFVWMTITAPLSLLDKNIGRPTSARFYAYITEKSHSKMLCIFLTGGAYSPYATCIATPLHSGHEWVSHQSLAMQPVNINLGNFVNKLLLVRVAL